MVPASAFVEHPEGAPVSPVAVGEPFDELFPRSAASLVRFFAVRTGDSHLAEDLAQQTGFLALRSLQQAGAVCSEAWLWTIARNVLRTHWRRSANPARAAKPDAELAAALAEKLVTDDLTTSEMQRSEVRDQLLLAITALPAREQELIAAFYYDGASYRSLAAALQVTERAVEARLYRARQALRASLERLGVTEM